MIGLSSPSYSVRPFGEVLEEISQHFQLWEILSDADHFLTDIASEVKTAQETTGMKFQVHLPFSDINIAALDRGTRKHAVNTICNLLECADDLGIKVAVLHPGSIKPMGYYDKARVPKLNREGLEEIERRTSNLSIKIAFENMPNTRGMQCRTPFEILEMLDGLDMDICLDIGHANITGCIDDFLTITDRLANVHLHDNLGEKDKHMTLGTGNIDFPKILAALKSYEGNFILETRDLPTAIESKAYLETIL